MKEQIRRDDPQSEESGPEAVTGAQVVADNQPGSKGDGSTDRAGQGGPVEDETVDEGIVRSRDQKPNPNQTATEATMAPGGDLGHKRTTL